MSTGKKQKIQTTSGRNADLRSSPIPVFDNLPDRIPVASSELEVIETYLTDVIAQLLDEAACEASHGSTAK